LKPVSYSNTANGPFALAAKSLAGNDLCSIADLSASEIAALLKLAHAVKARPRDYRYALDAKQLIMFFEKASLRTRLTLRLPSTHWAATRSSSTRPSRRSVSGSRSAISREM
jgi:aspartate carbamoyltransferase catalytic subunit